MPDHPSRNDDKEDVPVDQQVDEGPEGEGPPPYESSAVGANAKKEDS